jgi:hypothetical protein
LILSPSLTHVGAHTRAHRLSRPALESQQEPFSHLHALYFMLHTWFLDTTPVPGSATHLILLQPFPNNWTNVLYVVQICQ